MQEAEIELLRQPFSGLMYVGDIGILTLASPATLFARPPTTSSPPLVI